MLAFGSLFYSTKSIALLLKILGGIEIDYIYTQPTDFAVLIHVHTKVIYPKYLLQTLKRNSQYRAIRADRKQADF